jgi:tetratricopeptide (TPR) repeat protein
MARNKARRLKGGGAVTPQQQAKLQRHVQQTLKQAVRHHTAGRLPRAEALYKQILEADADNPQALHLRGALAHQKGDFDRAVELISAAIERQPAYGDAHLNLGNALRELGRLDEALQSYYRAVTHLPDLAEAHNNIGAVLKDLGQPEEGLDSFRLAIALQPHYAEAFANFGSALQDLGRLDEALACYQQAATLNPGYPATYDLMGSALRELGEETEALDCYRQARQMKPDDPDTQANYAGLLIGRMEDTATAIAESNKSLTLLRRQSFGAEPDEATVARLSRHGLPFFRLKHDLQQADYLAASGFETEGLDAFRQAGAEVLRQFEADNDEADVGEMTVRPDTAAAKAMLPYLQADFMPEIPELDSSALHPETDWQAVEQAYLDSENEIIHIDNFLSPEALAALRQFSLTAKVWLKDYPNKYLGAFSDRGYISPLHFRIARELQTKLPRVFGPHALGRFWAFKYDATLGKGINVHADFALVNLNFWITPDEYNLDPETGGLVVYDVPSPRSWHFKAYNEDRDGIYRFLKENDAASVRVPHRCNRAVLFNSAYFHETDAIRFTEGYESRRINITYLFGRR